MKIRSLNNATTLISVDGYSLLIDPWLIGDLYNGAWSPFAKIVDLDFLNSLNGIFISHIHEDHWDLDTLSLVNKDLQIYLPNMKVNRVIYKKLEQYGFSKIEMIDLGAELNINSNLTIKVI